MKYGDYDTEDLIAALATPWGESAIAVIRTSGNGSIAAFSGIFRGSSDPVNSAGYTMHYGRIVNPESGRTADEIVAGIYRKPRSYTGEEMVEIFCHGSMPGISSVMRILRKAGFRDASPGEFTLRSFLNGKMDLTQAEAVNEIIRARSSRAMEIALDRLSGAVYRQINDIKISLKEILTSMELMLDYAEDEADPEAFPDSRAITDAAGKLAELSSTYRIGKVIQEGVKAVLAGRTNAGKSSLFNLLNRMERSIVSEHHGTTRDYIESFILVSGIPVRLYDTAGLRESENPVEAEGIRKSEQLINECDIVLYLVDGSAGLTESDRVVIESFSGRNLIKIWNKADLGSSAVPEGFIATSALSGEGLEELEKAMAEAAGVGKVEITDKAVIDSERQKRLIDMAKASLENAANAFSCNMPLDIIAFDIREALDCLGEITGEITTADILEHMFSKFCVGK